MENSELIRIKQTKSVRMSYDEEERNDSDDKWF